MSNEFITVEDMSDEALDDFIRFVRTSRLEKSSLERTPTGKRRKPKEKKKVTAKQLAALMDWTLEEATLYLQEQELDEDGDDTEEDAADGTGGTAPTGDGDGDT